jgi:subtilisin family serine protease
MTRRLSASITKLSAAMTVALAIAGLAPTAHAAAGTSRVIVSFKPGSAAAAAARAAIANTGGRVKLEILGGGAVAVEMPSRMVAALRRHAGVAAVDADAKRYPMAALATPTEPPYRKGQLLPYGIPMVQTDQLPNGDKFAANRKLCIIDSGYDNTHEDLKGNDVTGEFDSGTGWWYTDEVGHGSHVAGTIAGINNINTGVVGVNATRKLKLHIVKVFGADGWAYSSTLANAAKKCQAAGANIISMSLGGPLFNPFENRTFADLNKAGILIVAAAGNAGNNSTSYPAGYSSVVSVGALDIDKAKADLSQSNKDVELAAPGIGVLSTVPMGSGREAALGVADRSAELGTMDGSPVGSASGQLADFGLGTSVDTAVAGKLCVIARGETDFATKVKNCQDSGGIGAVIYNNEPGGFLGTLGGVSTTIPSATASDTDGAALLGQLGRSASLDVKATNYAYYDGTSMATPHVAAAAALVWSYFPSCSNQQIRDVLNKTALDLGAAGRDNAFGFGLVQARAAHDALAARGCGN